MNDSLSPVGVIGGSGIYNLAALTDASEVRVDTPFGAPSDVLLRGRVGGRAVLFLPRHGRGHRILPTEINHRANIWALRSLGVRWLLSVGAVGSLQERYRPCDIVFPSQFFDRTTRRDGHTFFGGGIVAHVSFDEPTAPTLRSLLVKSAVSLSIRYHDEGTYVNIDGPSFSSRAESELNHRLGFDVVGMTNLAEAKLAREAEMAFAAIALVTDYDCWKRDEVPVTTDLIIQRLRSNADLAGRLLAGVIPQIPLLADLPEHRSLSCSLVTHKDLWPAERVAALRPILEPYL